MKPVVLLWRHAVSLDGGKWLSMPALIIACMKWQLGVASAHSLHLHRFHREHTRKHLPKIGREFADLSNLDRGLGISD